MKVHALVSVFLPKLYVTEMCSMKETLTSIKFDIFPCYLSSVVSAKDNREHVFFLKTHTEDKTHCRGLFIRHFLPMINFCPARPLARRLI